MRAFGERTWNTAINSSSRSVYYSPFSQHTYVRIYTCVGGQDYVSVSQSNGAGPSFEEVGQFCQVVVIISDNIVDGNETFLLALETDQDFVQLDSPNTTITIIDDDSQFCIHKWITFMTYI